MIHPVEPIVQKIHADNQAEPIPERRLESQTPGSHTGFQKQLRKRPEKQVNAAVEDHQVQIGYGVFKRIKAALMIMAQHHFEQNHYNVERHTD